MKEEKPTNYILDASFMLSYLLPDEHVEKVDLIFEKYLQGVINFISTHLLPFEVINGLKYAIKSKRISRNAADKLINDFLLYEIIFISIDLQETLTLSLDCNLTVYDASYLYLAQSNNYQLLTLDQKLVSLS